jgi:hypothetical protein
MEVGMDTMAMDMDTMDMDMDTYISTIMVMTTAITTVTDMDTITVTDMDTITVTDMGTITIMDIITDMEAIIRTNFIT